VKAAADVLAIVELLAGQHPDADTELHYANAFELLVATILSAQATDAGVNRVTPALFAKYPNARALAAAPREDVEALIHPTGFFRQKARALVGMAQGLVDSHAGEVPRTMDALVRLPGVGRKTANVVLGHALGVPGLPVDRHVLRVSNRLGIANSEDPERVEQQLTGALPPGLWTRASDTLILHGRRVCKPEPLCEQCAAAALCGFRRRSGRPALAKQGRPGSRRPPGRKPGKKTGVRKRP
jgi:endonuclease-3